MSHYEDELYEIYVDIDKKGLKEEFNTQILKMLSQYKHQNKTPKEMWEYAYTRVITLN